MGGRGMQAPPYGAFMPDFSFSFQTSPSDVLFTNVFTDKRFKGTSDIVGSDGKLISRAYLQQLVEKRPFLKDRHKQFLEDLPHATSVTLQAGKYQETFKLTESTTESVVAPKALESFFHLSWKSGGESQATIHMPYVVIDNETPRAGNIPFIASTNWRILSRDAQEGVDRYASSRHTFGQEKPTLSWVSGGKIRDLYIKGKDTNTFLEESGLRITLPKGPFTTAKRLSRVFRPYKHHKRYQSKAMQIILKDGRSLTFSSGALNRETLSPINASEVSFFQATLQDGQTMRIRYMEQSESEAKVWDGAGVVSRAMLIRTFIKPDMDAAEKAKQMHQIQKMGRVEYTILTPLGQDKGHAIVADTLESDFLLPQDTKTAVQLVNGTLFVGFSHIKAKDQLHLDEQTMINHRHFLPPQWLLSNLEEKGELYEQGIVNGRSTHYMREIDQDAPIETLSYWPFREFMATGGNPLWSATHTKTVYNQHLNKIVEMGEHGQGKVKLPAPGGRYYVMPASVGRRAGIRGLLIGRGEIQLDKLNGTAWVNEADWLKLQDGAHAAAGIASILGGADNDDALIVIPFTDKVDSQKKVLALRNPNEAGEYVVLKPTPASHVIQWETTDGEAISYPELDSRTLTPRIDAREKSYLHLIDPQSGPTTTEMTYSVEAMETAVLRAMNNAGIFERYANFLMVAEAIGYKTKLPDGLETLVDGMNKTGADLRPIDMWLKAEAEKMIASGVQVPAHLQRRTPKTKEGKRPFYTANHWIDQRQHSIEGHINNMRERRDTSAATAQMPDKLFDVVFSHPATIDMGAGYLKQYSTQLNRLRKRRPNGLRPEDHDFLRREAEQYLNQYPTAVHTSILRGAMVSLQMQETPKSDAALWLPGEQLPDGRYNPGIGNKMNEALREIGLLGDPVSTQSGTILYYEPSSQETKIKTVGIRDVWFHHYQWLQTHQHRPIPKAKSEIPKNKRQIAKQTIAREAQKNFKQMTLKIRNENGRFYAYTQNGNRFGTLDGAEHGYTDGDSLTIQHAYAVDGNLRVIANEEKTAVEETGE